MLERQKRLNEVYNYLHSNKGIHMKAGFADAPFNRNRSTDYSGPLFGTSGETSVMLNNEWSESFVGEW